MAKDTQFADRVRRCWKFVAEDIWDIEPRSLSRLRRFGVSALRVVHLVFRGFKQDECPLHASALTFSTLMSIVPVLALALALARGFGGTDAAKKQIRDAVHQWTDSFSTAAVSTNVVQGASVTNAVTPTLDAPTTDAEFAARLGEQIEDLVDQGFEKVEQISFAALGGVGLVLLIWMVISVLGRVEASFNRVWGVTRGRSIWRKFTDYLSVLLILPLLGIAAGSFSAADLATKFLDESQTGALQAILNAGVARALTVVLLSALCFTFFLVFMPNTKVRLGPGLVGGLVTAIMFIAWIKICAAFQVGVGRQGKIYGSFAVVPILLAWVYVSWEIILFGAEVAFAFQNSETYRMEQGARNANVRARMILALSIVVDAARAMTGDAESFNVVSYARRHRVPVRFLHGVVDELVRAGFLGALSGAEDTYALLKAPGKVRVGQVLSAVMEAGVPAEQLGLVPTDPRVAGAVDAAADGVSRTLEQQTIQKLLDEATAVPA